MTGSDGNGDMPSVMQCDTMYDMRNDRLFSLRLPSDMLDSLERIAESEDRTIADVIRRALREYLTEENRWAEIERLRQALTKISDKRGTNTDALRLIAEEALAERSGITAEE